LTPADRPAGVGLSDRRLIELAVVGVMVIWGANFIVVKGAIGMMPPVAFTFLRYALAAAALLVILRWSNGSIRLPRPDTWRILILGGLGFGIYQILWTVGLQTIPAGDSALLIGSTPVFVAVIAVLARTDTLSPLRALGVGLSFLGVAIVIGAGVGIELAGSPVGFALTLAATLSWATYTAVGARYLRGHSALELTTWATVGGTIVLAPIGTLQLLAPGAVDTATGAEGDLAALLLAILYAGILAAALANVVVFHGVRLLGPTRITAIQSLVPAMAVVMAFIFLGEPIRLGQVVGGAIIIGGVALTRIRTERRVPIGS